MAIITPLVRQQVITRARGQCECNIATHDHGFECQRISTGIVFKEGVIHSRHPLADDLMAVCSKCRSQIRFENGSV